jgi:hypothetical protein
MSVRLAVSTREFEKTLKDYARIKKKSEPETVNKAMRYWVPFAANKVKKLTPGKSKIRADMRSPAKHRKSKQVFKQSRKKRNKWTGTAAAAIVANRLLDKGIDPKKTVNFIEMVQKMVDSKLRSVSYLRSGFIPAFKEFKVPMRGDVSKKFKGRSMGVKAVPKPGDRIEAFTRNAREGTAVIAPNAFRDSLPEVRRQFNKWMMEKINRDAAKVGFKK